MIANSGKSRIVIRRSDESDYSENEEHRRIVAMPTPRRKALRVFDDSDDFKPSGENSTSWDDKDSDLDDSGSTLRQKPFRILDDNIVNKREQCCNDSDSDFDIKIRAAPRKKLLRILDDSQSDRDENNSCLDRNDNMETSDFDSPKKNSFIFDDPKIVNIRDERRRNSHESNDSDSSNSELTDSSNSELTDSSDSSDSDIMIRATPQRNPRRILDDSDIVKRLNNISMVDDNEDDDNRGKKSKSSDLDKGTDVIEILSDESDEDRTKQKSQTRRKPKNLKSVTSVESARKNSLTRSPQVRLSFLSSLSDETYGLLLHPKAEVMVKNYSKKKTDLALFLYQYYNFHIFDKKLPDIPLKWSSRLTSTAGRARMTRNQGISMDWNFMIELSNVLLSSAAQLRDTLVHEMCHVATCEIDKLPKANHGPPWKAWAKKCSIVFPELPQVQVCHQYEQIWKFVYICKCPKTKGRMTKIPAKNLNCQVCGEKMTLQK